MLKLLYAFIGIFVAMDIIGILPMYLSITKGMDRERKRRITHQSILVASILALAFVFLGKWIFRFLGISLSDFMMGGGVVLLVMAILDLVQSKVKGEHPASTGVVPLAMPLITGPGLITTVMIQVSLYGYPIVLLALFFNFLFAWVALRKSDLITRLIGDEGTDIVSKLGALFLTAIAISLIRRGIYEALKIIH